MSAITSRLSLPRRLPSVRLPAGISAIVVKELRGRMRGKRAFIVITIHLFLLAAFAWMFARISEEQISNMGSYGGQATYASATVGRGIFIGLLLLQTLIVSVLAPAATAGAISSEREHQTLDLLTVTPISSPAIVLGKLASALAWVFVLVLASIPVTALVFVFGGVAPDDVVRGYAVLLATVIGLGSVGIFFSALTRRTGAATGLTFVVTLGLTIGSLFIWAFFAATSEISLTGERKPPSDVILFLNPFVAQADVACGTEDGAFNGTCGFMSGILGQQPDQFNQPGVLQPVPLKGNFRAVGPAIGAPGVIIDDTNGGGLAQDAANAAVVDSFRDRFWPKSVLSFLILAAVMTTASIQFVSPTRRWRPSLLGPVRRRLRRTKSST